MAAESILERFEQVALNLGQSVKLPRPINRKGKPYGKASYHLASLDKPFPTKSLPLGYRWPGFEPNPNLDCDNLNCTSAPETEIKRLTCGHAFHRLCLSNRGCTICLPNLTKDIKKLSKAWNVRLMETDDGENSDTDDSDGPDDDDDNIPPLAPGNVQDPKYYNSKSFKDYVLLKSTKIKEIVRNEEKAHEL